jgi:hypothetical protein
LDRRDYERLEAFWEQLKEFYRITLSEDRPIGLPLGSFAYSLGLVSRLVDRVPVIEAKIPELKHFPGDLVNVSDVLAIMDKFEMLHNLVQNITPNLAKDLNCFISYLSHTLDKDVRRAMAGTAAMTALKDRFERETAALG